jgi:hypothetical protein
MRSVQNGAKRHEVLLPSSPMPPHANPAPNQLYYGDNLTVLRDYIPSASVDLIYLDPPFNSRQDYNVLFAEKDGARSADLTNSLARLGGATDKVNIVEIARQKDGALLSNRVPYLRRSLLRRRRHC